MKKFLIYAICIIQIAFLFPALNVYADDIIEDGPVVGVLAKSVPQSNPKKIVIDAGAAVIMDVESGRVLFDKNAYTRKAIASTTKIMTAILAIENGDLDGNVTISKRAASVWGSTIDLKVGQVFTLKELLYGLMLKSGNDAAIAIAEHIGGSVEAFADMMNQKAQELGTKDTQFKSPHGLDMDGHYSTAYDLALITRYALNNPVFSRIVGTRSATIPGKDWQNTNEMLSLYPGADGVKTGYTGNAGRCLVTSATRNGMRIISVVLNCPTRTLRAKSSKTILDYGFENYKPYTLIRNNEEIRSIPVVKGKQQEITVVPITSISLPLRHDEIEGIQTEVILPDDITAPVAKDIEVGSIKFLVNGQVIAETALKTTADVERRSALDYLLQMLKESCRIMRQIA